MPTLTVAPVQAGVSGIAKALPWLFLWLRPFFGVCPLNHRVPDPPCWFRHPFGYQR